MVTLSAASLAQYERFSLFNSPYPAHDRGRAIDLYPPEGTAPSPVAGVVRETRTVQAPPKPYAVEHDHLVVVDLDREGPAGLADHGDAGFARVLHVDPAVEAGDRVAVGDSLGTTVRSGFFAPWVADHLHVGFRPPDANPVRASGSLPVGVPVTPDPVEWAGRGTVVERGETFVVLDTPAHPAPGDRFVALGCEVGDDAVTLDGGLPHYDGGGVLGRADALPVRLLGTTVGTVAAPGMDDGREYGHRSSAHGGTAVHGVDWSPLTLRANGDPIRGLSLFATRVQFGVKLVCPGHDFALGDAVTIDVEPANET